jgi:hypothetical protein
MIAQIGRLSWRFGWIVTQRWIIGVLPVLHESPLLDELPMGSRSNTVSICAWCQDAASYAPASKA